MMENWTVNTPRSAPSCSYSLSRGESIFNPAFVSGPAKELYQKHTGQSNAIYHYGSIFFFLDESRRDPRDGRKKRHQSPMS
jgi:hypothetical protein